MGGHESNETDFYGNVYERPFFDANKSEMCRGESSEKKQDASVALIAALLTLKTLIVGGGINGGRIKLENNYSCESWDASDGNSEAYKAFVSRLQRLRDSPDVYGSSNCVVGSYDTYNVEEEDGGSCTDIGKESSFDEIGGEVLANEVDENGVRNDRKMAGGAKNASNDGRDMGILTKTADVVIEKTRRTKLFPYKNLRQTFKKQPQEVVSVEQTCCHIIVE